MSKRPARQPPAARAARPRPRQARPGSQPPQTMTTNPGEPDLDACIATMAAAAPPLTGE